MVAQKADLMAASKDARSAGPKAVLKVVSMVWTMVVPMVVHSVSPMAAARDYLMAALMVRTMVEGLACSTVASKAQW